MGYFYFDESIHPRGGFILGAYVYSDATLDTAVARAIESLDLQPGIDEFKSGRRVDGAFPHERLRGKLRDVLRRHDARVGLVVAPSSDRHLLGEDALEGLRKFVDRNQLGATPHHVFIDEGVFPSAVAATVIMDRLGLLDSIILQGEADSRRIGGIQLADLAAHTMATMLLEHMGLVTKKVKAGPNSGYDSDLEIEIGFELWASLRYNFFRCEFKKSLTPTQSPSPILDVASCGLYVSERCSDELRAYAEGRFGTVYLGCIH